MQSAVFGRLRFRLFRLLVCSCVLYSLRDFGDHFFLVFIQGEVTSRIVGICASAASVIAMAGNKVEMSPTAEIMIHNASTISWGDHQEMDKTSNFLKKVDKSIANAYRLKTGLSEEELLNLMGEETWLTAEEAKEKGFVDEIMFENETIRAVASAPGALSSEAIAKIRNSLQKEPKGITMDELKNALNEYKEEMVAEVAERVKNTTTNQEPKEPKSEPAKKRRFASALFESLKTEGKQ